jgi:hypothetical protein
MPQRPPWHAFRLGGVPLSWWAILSSVGTAAFVGLFLSSEDFDSVLFGIGGTFAGLILLLSLLVGLGKTISNVISAYREGLSDSLADPSPPTKANLASLPDERAAPQLPESSQNARTRRQNARTRLLDSLAPPLRSRADHLDAQCSRLRDLIRGTEDSVTRYDSLRGTDRLSWLHLKLLIAHQHLAESIAVTDASGLEAQADSLRAAIANPSVSDAARASRQGTLAIIEERLRNRSSLRQRLDEADSDLTRIEAQLALALERAVLHSGADIATFQLDLASRMVDSADFFGAMLPDVRSLEQSMLSPE